MATKAGADTAASPRRRGRPPRVSADEIVTAATELFALRGYRATTIAAIAAQVGVTDAAVLHYFETKLALLEAVLEVEDREARRDLRERMAPGGIEALRRLAEYGEVMETHPLTTGLLIALTAEGLGQNSELHPHFVRRYRIIRRQLTAAIQQGMDRGEIKADIDPWREATAFVAFLDGLRLQWFYAEGDDHIALGSFTRDFIEQMISRISVPARRR